MRQKFATLLTALFLFYLQNAQAELLLTLDTDAKTLSFSGSDSGHVNRSEVYVPPYWTWPGGPIPISVIYWEMPVHTDESDSLDIAAALDILVNGTPNSALVFSLINTGDIGIGIGWWGASSPEESDLISITGNSTPISYAAWDASQISALENLAASGKAIPLTSGSGFSPIAVPEPGSATLMLAALLLMLRCGYLKNA
ncbi:MAG: hypothetical protein ACK5LK_06250 [Chthoniobacterales bacterium]